MKHWRIILKVYDVFPFFNELDLLEIRLNTLNDFVDEFIIIEADTTHSGLSKPYFADGALSKLIVSHPNLPHPFKFNAEFIDMGFESNCSFSELTVFVRGRKIDEQKPVFTSLPHT